MSSSYPPFGNAAARPCQRCGMPLPLNEVNCANCGQYHPSAQANNAAQPPSGTSWGGAASSPNYGSNQIGAQLWGQPPAQASQNDSLRGFSTPQQSFGAAGQPYPPFQPQQFQQLANSNNIYGAPGQQPGSNGSYAAPGSPLLADNFYRAPGQPFNPQPATGEFPPGSMNGYPSAGFGLAPGQAVTGGFSSGAVNGYQSAGFAQPSPQAVLGGFQPGSMNGFSAADFVQVPERKRGPRIGVVIGIIVLLLVVVGGSVFGYEYLKKQSAATTTPPVPTVAPTTVPKGASLFSDSFTSNRNNWDTTSKAGQFSVKIGNGSLALEDDNNKLLWELIPGGRNFKDFFLTTDAALSKGTQDNGYGIYIRGASNQNVDIATYYRFELYGDGTFALFKGTVDASGTSKSSLLVNYTTSSAIRKQGQVNHIAISAKGATMSFVVNGQTLATISDNSYTSGSIALFVSNLQNTAPDAQATFSNLAIYPPQS
jgi:hypothetical protein